MSGETRIISSPLCQACMLLKNNVIGDGSWFGEANDSIETLVEK